MAKKDNAIYKPGELSNLRNKLGVTDQAEAKRLAKVLGGEVGTEQSLTPENPKNKKFSRDDVIIGGKRGRRTDTAGDRPDERSGRAKPKTDVFPGDDPTVMKKLSYRERVKMDQLSGQLFFEIKTSIQVLVSVFSFLKEPVDYVNSRFVTRRMNEYFSKLENLVISTRTLFPKSNIKHNNQLKKTNLSVYKILNTIRSWNIEQIAKNISELQAHPRTVKVSDFTEILKLIYKPLYILSDLSIEHIKSAFKLIYKILYIENPMDAKEKYQDIIRNIIALFLEIRRDVQHGMYPLLMKLISDRFITYGRIFIERRRCFMAFLNVTAEEQLSAADIDTQKIDSVDLNTLQKESDDESDENGETGENDGNDEDLEGLENLENGENNEQIDNTDKLEEEVVKEEVSNDSPVIEQNTKEEAEKAEQRALEQGKSVLEALFPKAGWDKLDERPDLYPYFANIYDLKQGFELLSPTDPLQQISIIVHILDDLFIGIRNVKFRTITGTDGNTIKLDEEMSAILSNWRLYVEESFLKEYLPRLTEYCRMLENSEDGRTSAYAKKIMNELHWIKRLYFLPYYKFESIGPPPFTKQEIIPVYTQIRKIRKYFTSIAMGIEQGMRAGGAAAKAPCDGIINPWEKYNFQISNIISRRLNMILPPERKKNATLILFSLSVVTVMDYLINNESSWFYTNRSGAFFRSFKNEGIMPVFGTDERVDTEKLFRESLKKS
jgi:AAA ATPase containing von Willebrand factor type A (vWA) domain